jgi:hypothetical protein
MRAPLVVVLVTATLAASTASAQTPPTDYYGTERRYSTANVLSVLGKRQAHPPPRELLFDAEVQAGVSTKVNCGQLDVDVNVRAMADRVAQIPGQLVGQAQALLGAMPMLTLCYASPSLCAEVKNVNFQINERLKGLSDVCRSMDSYIASQSTSDAVREAAAKRGWERCVSEAQSDRHLSLSEAIELCKGQTRTRCCTRTSRKPGFVTRPLSSHRTCSLRCWTPRASALPAVWARISTAFSPRCSVS